MAHNITETNGKPEIAFAGNRPWHGLGNPLPKHATKEEMIVAAGLDWEVEKQPLVLPNGQPTPFFATVRTDTGAPLGSVSAAYKPVQNREAFAYLDELVGEELAMYEVAGSLKGGRQVWLLAKLPERIAVANRDKVDEYLLLYNSHDKTLSLGVMWTPVRVVCDNTLSVALGGSGRRFTTQHTMNIQGRMQQAKQTLGFAKEYFEQFTQEAERLVKTQVTPALLERFFGKLFGVDADTVTNAIRDGGTNRGKELAIFEVSGLFEHGKGNDVPGIRGSAWALWNGLTEYIDHSGEEKFDETKAERRRESTWFGHGSVVRQRGYDILLQAAS